MSLCICLMHKQVTFYNTFAISNLLKYFICLCICFSMKRVLKALQSLISSHRKYSDFVYFSFVFYPQEHPGDRAAECSTCIQAIKIPIMALKCATERCDLTRRRMSYFSPLCHPGRATRSRENKNSRERVECCQLVAGWVVMVTIG